MAKNKENATQESVDTKAVKKVDKKNDKKSNKKADKKTRTGVVQKTKEVTGELKKVTWPTFGKVVKTTGVVISVVLIFALVLLGLDRLLSLVYDLLVRAVA